MPYLCLNIILAQTVNFGIIEFVLGFLLFLLTVGTAVVNIVRGNKKDLDGKLDKTEFSEFKVVNDSRLGRKLNRDIFEEFQESIYRDIEEHKRTENLQYKLMREELNIMKSEQKQARDVSTKLLEQNAQILTEISWIKNNLKR